MCSAYLHPPFSTKSVASSAIRTKEVLTLSLNRFREVLRIRQLFNLIALRIEKNDVVLL